MDGLILDYYGIAEESVSFDGVKKRIDQIIMTVRNWIQRVVNWVSTKFMNFMNMDQVQIGQKYYNDIMGTIKSILNVDSKGIDKFVMDFNTIRNNPEGVKKAGENIAKRLQDLEDLAENMKKITPSENDHLLTLSQSSLKSFQSQLYNLRDEAQRKLQCIMRMKRDPLDSENLKYTSAQVILIGQCCLIDQKKSQLCIDLMTKLMNNCKVVDKTKKKDDIIDDEKDKKEKSNMDNHAKMLGASESIIQLCDELYIAEEKYSDAKKIYKEGNNKIAALVEKVGNMPETTSEEAKAKKAAYSQLASRVYDIYQEVNKVRASGMDKFLSGLVRLTASVTDAVADSEIRSNAYGLSAQSPDLSAKVKDIAIFTGVKWLAREVGKGTGGERTIHKIKDKLSTLYDKYTSEAKRLNMKANELAKKEAANNPPKEEQSKDESKASESTTFWDAFLTACEEV